MNLFLNIIFIFHFFQLNWKTDVDDNLIFDYDCDAFLYATTAAIPCITYKLVCRNGACVVRWNGYHEKYFVYLPKYVLDMKFVWSSLILSQN